MALLPILRTRFLCNRHPVQPLPVWRMARASMSDARFARILERLGIRTALDLRRAHRSDAAEGAIDFAGRGIAYHNVHLRASDLPNPLCVARVVDILQEAERPLLLYCKRGRDKTGFAAALYQCVVNGYCLEGAWQQLRYWPYGHRCSTHRGPHRFRELLLKDRPDDFVRWIHEEYPQHYRRLVRERSVQPITPEGMSLPYEDPRVEAFLADPAASF